MDFLFTLILLSLVLAMWDLLRRWLFSSSDLEDRGED